ncbi:MAG: HNH endonuclease [Clostridia bacterium]|nr:HNH endonuclease [Clostridia bacterium]
MRQEFARKFYSSRAWAECRAAYKKSRGGLCEECEARGLFTPGDEVHHKVKLTPENITDPTITLNWDNLQLLCKACHAEQHRKGRRWGVRQDGKVIIHH